MTDGSCPLLAAPIRSAPGSARRSPLVARALPNREIAARLVVSERTVESHVRRILAKTGLTSRTELTRWFLGLPERPTEDPSRPAVRG